MMIIKVIFEIVAYSSSVMIKFIFTSYKVSGIFFKMIRKVINFLDQFSLSVALL
jgi:hypothetical protein